MFSSRELNRMFSKINIDKKTKCWNYTGYLSDGYGRIFWRGKRYKAHRLFYLWKYGKLPTWKNKKSKEIDHLCKNRACVNPEHLQLVDCKINIIRGSSAVAENSRKEKCIHGHKDLYRVGNRRRCRTCRKILDGSLKRKLWRKNRREKKLNIYSL